MSLSFWTFWGTCDSPHRLYYLTGHSLGGGIAKLVVWAPGTLRAPRAALSPRGPQGGAPWREVGASNSNNSLWLMIDISSNYRATTSYSLSINKEINWFINQLTTISTFIMVYKSTNITGRAIEWGNNVMNWWTESPRGFRGTLFSDKPVSWHFLDQDHSVDELMMSVMVMMVIEW